MRILYLSVLFFALLSIQVGYAQTVNFEDGFEDGDFTNNPTWSKDTGQYDVIDGTPNFLLQLQGDDVNGDVSSLSTPSTNVEGSWEFYIDIGTNPSGGNNSTIFLMSNLANLEGSVDGYAVQAGEALSNDVFRIVRYDGGSEAATIVSGTTDISSGGEFRVRVTRQSGGNWTLEVGEGYDGALSQEGGTGTDNMYTTTQFFGVRTEYSSSNATNYTYDFKIDLPPFTITDATVVNDREIDVTFNQDYNQGTVETADFNITKGVGSPTSVSFESATVVRLTYGSDLPSDEYTLTAQNIEAQNGQLIEPDASATFIVFADYAVGDVVINEFAYDAAGSQSEYVELKNTSGKFLNLRNWQIADQDGVETISSGNVVLRPSSFLAISEDTTALFNVYGTRNYFEIGNLRGLNNTGDAVEILTGTGTQVDFLEFTPVWGGEDVALERRSDTAPSIYKENFGDSPNSLGGTPGIANEVADDNTPPDLDDLTITDNQTLDLDFSERLENGNATNAANYALNNGINITSAQQTAADNVQLSLSAPLQNGTQYQLTIQNQQDIFSNTTAPIDSSFTYYEPTPADSGDIFINEFMYDPPVGNSEYIELHNPTNESFDLNGWTINDNSGNPQAIINSSFIVPPDSFVVIAPDQTLLTDYPSIALISMGTDFPGLNNGDDDIVLRDNTGERLDTLTYSDAWGGSEIALERRKTEIEPIQANFGDAPNGFGTPGKENQIPQDNTAPGLSDLIIANNQTLNLAFSETLSSSEAENPGNYTLSNGIAINGAQQTAPDSVQLSLASPLQNATEYNLAINEQQDVFGNTAAAIDTSFTFYEVSAVDSGDVFINEFTYDPLSGSTEYIELHNSTSQSFDLNGWTINDNTGNRQTITNNQFIVPPDSFVVIAPDGTLLNDNPNIALVSMGNDFPSLNNSGDDIVLRDDTGERLDSLTYTSTWGGDQVALERRTINVKPIQANFGDAPNEFGTPGETNQIPQDNAPPNLENLSILDNQTLNIAFSEGLASGPATNADNYAVDNGISVSSVQQFAPDSAQLTLSSALQNGVSYELAITNQQDIFGNTASALDTTFTYFETSTADSGDIFLNEFTYNPPEGSTEYIELYNTTAQSFDLNGWTINDNTGDRQIITNSQFIVPPDSFVVIAPDNSLLQNNPDISLVAMGSGFPSLNNSGDDLVLRNAGGQRLDSLTYTSGWGGNKISLERRTTTVGPFQSNFVDAPNGTGTPGRENQAPADSTPPDLQAFSILSNQSLEFVFTERLDAQSATNTDNYTFSADITVNTATQSGDTVRVQLSGAMQNDTDYTATINGVNDLFGNALTNRDTTFTYFEVSIADSGDVFINEFNYDPQEGSSEYIELINPTGRSYNLSGWTINDNTGNRRTITDNQFILPPNSVAVIAPDQTLKQDSPGISLIPMGSGFPSLNNSGDDIVLRNASGQRLDSLQYSNAWGGNNVSLERRTTAVGPFRSNFGDSPNGFGTPGEPNEITNDTTPPDIISFSIADNQSLEFVFSEQLEEQSATDPDTYALSSDITIDNAALTNDNSVRLTLSDPLENDVSYTATVNGLNDLFGNTLSNRDTTFTYFEVSPADSGDIFINEFMYDPPSGQTEYVELYNPTGRSLNIQNWTINDNTGNRRTITNEQFIIPPDSFVVIAPDQTLLENNPGIALVSMGSGFPSLNNSGDNIVLRDSTGQRLDSLQYQNQWGGNQIALERRTIAVAPFRSNFGSAPNGFGTPGNANEIPEDTTPPELAAFSIASAQSLEFIYTERVDAQSATNVDNYSLSGGISITGATLAGDDTVRVALSGLLQDNTNYTATIDGVDDVFGNTLTNRDTTFTYFEVSPADSGDIFINEFMYDPPSGQTEYVELYNPTGRSLNIQNWTINDNTGNRQVITEEQFIVPPDSFVVIAPDQSLLEDYPDIALVTMGSRFPSLNNSGDDLVLRDQNGARLDSLQYTSDWGGNEVGLERRTVSVNPIQANFGDAPNGVGTPGSVNGIAPDEQPPVLNSLRVQDKSTLQLIFSETINSETATNKVNYAIKPSRGIQLISSVQDKITLFLSQDLQPKQTYQLTVTGLQDVFGNTIVETTREVTFVPFTNAQPGNVVINEFLYNRASAGAPEFVELFNRTDQNFDLSGWTIGDASGAATIDAGTRLLPGEYLVITDNASLANAVDNGVFLSNFPSLNDDEDAIYIQSDNGTAIDSLFYNINFGGDIDGKSAERQDPAAASNDAANFATSTADDGSTPGAQNSVYMIDETPPTITFSRIFPNGDIEVRFSEFITLTPDLSFTASDQTLSIDDFDPANGDVIFLNTPPGLTPQAPNTTPKTDESLTITAQNLSDVRGNVTASVQQPVSQPLLAGDVVINEILFDPLSDSDDNQPDQAEYIELRNIRDYAISLEGITLHDAPDEDGNVRTLTPVSTQSKYIPAQGTVLIYAEDKTSSFDQSKVAQFFDLQNYEPSSIIRVDRSSLSLASTDDAIFLTGDEGTEIDSVYYSESWHNPNLVDTDGVALERINPFGPSNSDANWGSSTNEKGGTPNQENTLFQTAGDGGQQEVGISFTPNPFSPDDDGDEDNLFINYKLDQPDYLMTVRIYDRYGRLVRELADSEQAGLQGSLIWDGRKDNGTRNRIGIYIVIFKAFDSAGGDNKTFKKTVVLARRLN